MGKVVGCSSGPDPFPGVPVREPFVPQQPGEVLIRYELEAADGCCSALNPLGWCCFGVLCCLALPLSWLPFVLDACKRKWQRPVFGYPMAYNLSFLSAQDAAWQAHKQASTTGAGVALTASAGADPVAGTPAPAASIVCLDISLAQQQHELKAADQQQQHVRHLADRQLVQMQPLRCSPSPPPISIFVPPSAVPACGFTADHPFPCRYSPATPTTSRGSSLSPGRGGGVFGPYAYGAPGCGAPSLHQPASPGTGLPVAGMGGDAEQQEQEAAHLRHQQQQAAAAAAATAMPPPPEGQTAGAVLQHWSALAAVHAVQQ